MTSNRTNFFATGTWFQPFGKVDYPDTLFMRDSEYWDREFSSMKGLGFDTFIFQFAAHNDIAYYNTKLFDSSVTIIEEVINKVEKYDFSLILGLYLSTDFYRSDDYIEVLNNQYKLAVSVFDELLEKYGDLSKLKYWYIPQEIESTTFAEKGKREALINFINRMVSYIRKKSDLPILIAPYFALDGIEHFDEWWDSFLDRVSIDVMAMQDGMGCTRGIKLENLPQYYSVLKRVCAKHNVKLWSTLEIFEYIDAPNYNNKSVRIEPAPFERIKKQIDIETQYVEKVIFFEFAHFMSPQFSDTSRELYNNYIALMDLEA